MIPKTTIEKAIEGGWTLGNKSIDETLKFYVAYEAVIALDSSFWQALGKALGWGIEKKVDGILINQTLDWHHYAMRFYHLILTNQPTEAFWSELLASPNKI